MIVDDDPRLREVGKLVLESQEYQVHVAGDGFEALIALHAEAWLRTLEHFGIQIGLDEAWRQIGKGGDQVIPVFVPEADRERLEKPLKDFRKEIFHRDYMFRMVAFSQARELLLV